MPKYKRIVEDFFQRKLLALTICTETLSAGINLPARSVVVPELLKGPPDKKKLIDPSSAHQIFGRAGRPQFDTQGFVFALAHEDDVKLMRWREKYDSIPEDTKDPQLRKAKKALKKKMPKRRSTEHYWTEAQFDKLRTSPPGKLSSRGALPWRLLAYWLDASPEVDKIRELISRRLLYGKGLEASQKMVDRMLLTLWSAGYVELEPEPPKGDIAQTVLPAEGSSSITASSDPSTPTAKPEANAADSYRPHFARATPEMSKLLLLRGVNPLYGVFLVNQLGIADRNERIQALESVLELPPSVAYHLHVPPPDELPPGPLATTRLDIHLFQLGLATAEQLGAAEPEEREGPRSFYEEEKVYVLTLADKLRLWFDYDFPGVHGLRTRGVWAAGELLAYGGDFNKFITSKGLQKQEGVIFRHLLRLILLIGELTQLAPPDFPPEQWREELDEIAERLARVVPPCRSHQYRQDSGTGQGRRRESALTRFRVRKTARDWAQRRAEQHTLPRKTGSLWRSLPPGHDRPGWPTTGLTGHTTGRQINCRNFFSRRSKTKHRAANNQSYRARVIGKEIVPMFTQFPLVQETVPGAIVDRLMPGDLVPIVVVSLALLTGMIVALVSIVMATWRKMRERQIAASLIQDMLDRNMSPPEIQQLIGMWAHASGGKVDIPQRIGQIELAHFPAKPAKPII